jgi:hypothetical protein
MKKIILVLLILVSVNSAHAQKDTVWRKGGLIAINFSQVSLTNWAAGGQNSITGNAIVNYFANYKSGKKSWDNNIDLGYGLAILGKHGRLIKSDDRIDISSKYGRQASKNWYYSALFNFRSQFMNGYNYPNDSVVISKFLSPGYVLLGLGMDFKPNDNFSLFLSPATLRFIIVTNNLLSAAGAFGVDPGETVKTEVGAFLRAVYKKDLTSTLNLQTSLDLFSNYLDNPQNIDIYWQTLFLLKVSKYISASLSLQLLYDDDTKITFYKDDGTTVDHIGPGTQFKEAIGIGFAYKFSRFGVK